MADCSGGGGSPAPRSVATATPTPATGSAAAYECPTSAGASSSAVARTISTNPRRMPALRYAATSAAENAGLIAVSYRSSVVQSSRPAVVARELALGASSLQEYVFRHIGHVTRVLSVAPLRAESVMAALRAQPGVIAVGPAGLPRAPSSVTSPYFPNDPYFTGFAANYEVGPLEESSDVPGQWDMHVTQLEHAFAYSQSGNGSGLPASPNALGSSAVSIAILDTGEDTTHPELSGKVVYQKCYITNPSGVQSVSNFTDDPFGHGTDVSGIAAATTNNGLGFAGAGGNVVIYGYRIFPTPDDSCAGEAGDAQCDTTDQDIASAIDDAVAHNVNVISLSLGGNSCSSPGVDPSTLERDAIAEAVAANIVVVAAAGNNSAGGKVAPLQAPACDSGVIAVGATGLADGQPNGAGNSGGSASSPYEYLASYSNAGTPGAALNSASAWGIVAPGSDPAPGNDLDNLHWVQNIWTTTPYQANPGDMSFLGECTDDYPHDLLTTPPVDCRTLIAGTSMSAPHVAGAAALILSVSAAYQSPTAMKQLLCTTADNISDPHEGCGRLNVYRAMAAALSDPHPPPPSGTP